MTVTTVPRTGRGRPRRPAVPSVSLPLPLPAAAWTQWADVRVPVPGGAPVAVHAIVLGPTGIHVVLRAPAAGAATVAATDAADDVTPVESALAAGQVLRDALPPRYRTAVSSALVVGGDGDGELVGGVVVATELGLAESIALRPRVLSRSETDLLSAHLDRLLAPEVTDVARPGLWRRLRGRSRAAAA